MKILSSFTHPKVDPIPNMTLFPLLNTKENILILKKVDYQTVCGPTLLPYMNK